jgi:hypothetical protein
VGRRLGLAVELTGGFERGRMVLTGEEIAPGGRTIRLRHTIAAADTGVRQTLEISRDGGDTWYRSIGLAYRRD